MRAGSPPSSEDLRAAAADPVVRQALELFDGSLVNVERMGNPGSATV
jgi:hypothetical protein